MVSLISPIEEIPFVKGVYATRLKRLGIETVSDLLYHVPFRYEDFSLVVHLDNLRLGEIVTIQGTILSITNTYTKSGLTIQRAKIGEKEKSIDVTWYNQPFLTKILTPHTNVSLSGEVKAFKNTFFLESPQYEILRNPFQKSIHTGRLVPIYPETEGVSSKWLRSRIDYILTRGTPEIPEFLPSELIRKLNLMEEKEAVREIHFPTSLPLSNKARRRLSFDEVFLLQCAGLLKKYEWEKKNTKICIRQDKKKKELTSLIASLPFILTHSQKKALSEIFEDFNCVRPMNRLLVGDVGSGKTVVAGVAMYLMHLFNYQSALLTPTEILATQHFKTIEKLLSPFGVRVGLITSKNKPQNQYDILVGTHALLSPKVTFSRLGFVVIDEQQRFGVNQRATIRKKGDNPHLLSMTATPIPRTIALTLFADLSLSTLEEVPIGRKRVKTWVVPDQKRKKAYRWIENQIQKGKVEKKQQQAFIICPFIEESESLQTVKAATKEYERLKQDVFPHLRLGLLHGKMKSEEKNKILTHFEKGECDILVATPVVEVGIDIPQATIMLIEGAERFGLSQLHQLRGRVGRRDEQSYCLLFSAAKTQRTLKRLSLLTTLYSGPQLAEHDLKLRGPGDLYGTRQSGLVDLKIASFSDITLFKEVKEEVGYLLKSDPSLSHFPLLRDRVQKYTIKEVAED